MLKGYRKNWNEIFKLALPVSLYALTNKLHVIMISRLTIIVFLTNIGISGINIRKNIKERKGNSVHCKKDPKESLLRVLYLYYFCFYPTAAKQKGGLLLHCIFNTFSYVEGQESSSRPTPGRCAEK